MVTLVLILVPFSVLQIRHGIYPQTGRMDGGVSRRRLNSNVVLWVLLPPQHHVPQSDIESPFAARDET